MKSRLMMVVLTLAVMACATLAQATALTADRDTPQRAKEYLGLTVASNALIYAGAMVAVNSNGYAVAAADTAGYAVIGRAEEYVDNRGTLYVATKSIKIAMGTFQWRNVDSITDADIGKLAYVTDDNGVNKTGGGQNIIAGSIVDVDAAGVWVDTGRIGPIGATTPASVAVSGNATVGGTLAVTGASTLTGNTAVGGTLAVTGTSTLTNVTVLGTLGVAGATTVSNFTANGTVNVPPGSIANAALAAVGLGVYTNAQEGWTNVFDGVGRLVSHNP